MTTPAAALFRRCNIALHGEHVSRKEQMARALGVKVDSIDAMEKGEKRIPPGIWREVHARLIANHAEMGGLISTLFEKSPATFEGEAIPPAESFNPYKTTVMQDAFTVETPRVPPTRKR